jgi:hypothetical protein
MKFSIRDLLLMTVIVISAVGTLAEFLLPSYSSVGRPRIKTPGLPNSLAPAPNPPKP